MPSPSPVDNLELPKVRRARPLLGTMVEIEVAADRSTGQLHAAIDDAFQAITQIHGLMSYHDSRSELSRLNRLASTEAQRVDPRTYQVLQYALRFAELSDGAFDPCVAPRLEALGFLPQVAGPANEHATWRDIALMRSYCVRFLKPLKVDLGGIAKGFAVDSAVEVLQRLGIDEIYVNAGGDLRVEGNRQRGILLRNPAAPAQAGHRLLLQKGALATSAAYFSRIMHDGKQFSALIDGRTRNSYAGENSISVRADTCLASDALTKIVLFAKAPISEACLTRFNARAYVLGLAG